MLQTINFVFVDYITSNVRSRELASLSALIIIKTLNQVVLHDVPNNNTSLCTA